MKSIREKKERLTSSVQQNNGLVHMIQRFIQRRDSTLISKQINVSNHPLLWKSKQS